MRLFVDMDGTLATFTPVNELEALYEKNYFLDQKPQWNVVEAVKDIIKNCPDIEVNILSAYLSDSKYALNEKNEWLNQYLPEIDKSHRIFLPCGCDKKDRVKGGVRPDDFLLDDYTKNLNDWQPPARGIKLLNSINHTKGTWQFDRIRYDRDPSELSNGIVSIMKNEGHIFDQKILKEIDDIFPHIDINEDKFKSYLGNDNPMSQPMIMSFNDADECIYWFNKYDFASIKDFHDLKAYIGDYGFQKDGKLYVCLYEKAHDIKEPDKTVLSSVSKLKEIKNLGNKSEKSVADKPLDKNKDER